MISTSRASATSSGPLEGVAVFAGASVVAMSPSHQPATTAPGIANPDGHRPTAT
jgi:hypothetical protein